MSGATSTGQGPQATVDQVLDLDALERRLPELSRDYAEAPPFPHIALDGFLDPAVAHAATLEVPPVERVHWVN